MTNVFAASRVSGAVCSVLVHALDKRCPGEPAFQLVFSKGFRRINRRIFNYGLSHAAFLVGVPAVVPYQMDRAFFTQ